ISQVKSIKYLYNFIDFFRIYLAVSNPPASKIKIVNKGLKINIPYPLLVSLLIKIILKMEKIIFFIIKRELKMF
ncbi:hypothetical protein LZW50_08370, partial [Campylobacter coli]|nr:hypothetical protein [Campylobacter coli]